MGAAGGMWVADSIARVAAAVESETRLGHALWAEDYGHTGPSVPLARHDHNYTVRHIEPGDVEVWEAAMDAVLGTVEESMAAIM